MAKIIEWTFFVLDSKYNLGYDMIIGRDLLCEIGLIIDFYKKY